MVLEIICSFLMILVYVILNEDDDDTSQTEIRRDPSLMSMFWTVAFGCCLAMTKFITQGSLNPAVAFGIIMTQMMDGISVSDFWIYLPMPYVGAIVALFFYQLIYLKTKGE